MEFPLIGPSASGNQPVSAGVAGLGRMVAWCVETLSAVSIHAILARYGKQG